jgi:hypothetical protein
MSESMEVFAAYKKLSVTDRIVFYTTLSNNVMFIQILSRRLTVHNSDISARPPLAFIT